MQTLIKQNLHIFLHTNGMFEKEIAMGMQQWPASRVTPVMALDGIRTNDYFRGKGVAKKIIRNIESLSKAFFIQLDILLTHRLQWEEIEILAQLAKKHRLTLAFKPVFPVGRANVSHVMPAQDFFNLMVRLEEFRRKGIKIKKCFDVVNDQLVENQDCPVRSPESIYISADGSFYQGGFPVLYPSHYIGNVRDSSFKDLLRHAPPQTVTMPIQCQACQFQKDDACIGFCPAYSSPRLKHEDAYCLAQYENDTAQ